MQKTLDKLLTLDPPAYDWLPGSSTALKNLELSASDAADLIAIAQQEHLENPDIQEADEAYYDASIHAYRLLAELQDPSHIPIFLDLILSYYIQAEEDFLSDDILNILPHYGEPAVAPTLDMLNNQELDENARLSCPDILCEIAKNGIATEAIIQAFSDYLTQKHFTRNLNGLIIASLLDLDAASEIDAIRTCYDAHLTVINICGDLEEVEVALGLREGRTSELPNLNDLEEKEYHLATKEHLGPLPDDATIVERFDYLLKLYQRDCSLLSLFELHAFLTGILLSPIAIPPSQYYPLIWDNNPGEDAYTPTWENEDDASFFMRTLMDLHNAIIRELASGDIPIPVSKKPDEEELQVLVIWLLRLLGGITHWADISNHEELPPEHVALIALIADIMETAKEAEQNGKRLNLSRHFKDLKNLLSQIHRDNLANNKSALPSFTNHNFDDAPFSHPIEPHHRDTQKISRNAPCPCGSGKKYKRCCQK